MRQEEDKMMAIVNQRRKKELTFLMLKVDAKHDNYLTLHVRKQSHFKVHVYFFDSLSTTVREFRTIKSCEFFPTADLILNPEIINAPNDLY